MNQTEQSRSPIAIGSDEAGYPLRARIEERLRELGYQVDAFGSTSADDKIDYPDVAVEVGRRIAAGSYGRAILVCGTGIGMAIAANKVPGVRAAQAADAYSAERARKSNDAQVLTLGSRTLGVEAALTIVDHWLAAEYEGGRSAPKVAKLEALDHPE
ncbi:MAG: ribose 5-phosphate isomerase B [Chloroflexota bacterium]